MNHDTRLALENIGYAALSSGHTVKTSYALALEACDWNVPGDFVECGVFGGAQCAAMALALMQRPQHHRRRVHLFDSFAGIPQAGQHDLEFLAAGHQAGLSACSVEGVQHNMRAWGIDDRLLVYHPGFFEDTMLDENLPPQIAILRLDSDLYESTKVCIEALFPYVVPGGWIVVDDFVLSGARKAVDDYLGNQYPPIYFRKT